ncbi:MAG TPA: hypothetical protein VIF32_12190 [Gemmatimonadaceae bacterium]
MESDRARDPSQVEYGELPELTRALRALGSARRSGGPMQTQFFLPLLDARRRAAVARSAAACVRAFDVADLNRALARAIERIVAGWPDKRPSVRRALHAELVERVREYVRALALLSERARAALAADEPSKLQAWRAWTVQLAATFDAADRSWMSLRSVVDALPAKPKP